MPNIIRTAKSGSHWGQDELDAYGIIVVYQDAPTFFNTPVLPEPQVHPDILTKLAADDSDMPDDDSYTLLRTMDLAMRLTPAQESAVDDFAVQLFRVLGYLGRGRVARTRNVIPLYMCGEHTKSDVCILDGLDDIVLLVQEDKCHLEDVDPEPQLIAEAIAAFQANNITRKRSLGLPPIDAKTIAGITMTGTAPTFYKIPLTRDLVTAIQRGVCPLTSTTVYAHVPDILRPARRYNEGMKPLDNRRQILACYEAFKPFVM